MSSETAKHGRQVYLHANEPSMVKLQAHWRGYLARKTFNERKQFMTKQLPAIIKIQVTNSEVCMPNLVLVLRLITTKEDGEAITRQVVYTFLTQRAYRVGNG